MTGVTAPQRMHAPVDPRPLSARAHRLRRFWRRSACSALDSSPFFRPAATSAALVLPCCTGRGRGGGSRAWTSDAGAGKCWCGAMQCAPLGHKGCTSHALSSPKQPALNSQPGQEQAVP